MWNTQYNNDHNEDDCNAYLSKPTWSDDDAFTKDINFIEQGFKYMGT